MTRTLFVAAWRMVLRRLLLSCRRCVFRDHILGYHGNWCFGTYIHLFSAGVSDHAILLWALGVFLCLGGALATTAIVIGATTLAATLIALIASAGLLGAFGLGLAAALLVTLATFLAFVTLAITAILTFTTFLAFTFFLALAALLLFTPFLSFTAFRSFNTFLALATLALLLLRLGWTLLLVGRQIGDDVVIALAGPA